MHVLRRWLTLLCFVLLVPVMVFTPTGLYHNWVFLAAYGKHGVHTSGQVTRIREQSGTRSRGRTVVVEHRPAGAQHKSELWLEGWYINQLTHDPGQVDTLRIGHEPDTTNTLHVGDQLAIIYLPESPNGRAILPADFDPGKQAPLEKLSNAVLFLALFIGAVTLRYLVRSR